MDVPVGTVKSRLFRGRRRLQERLRDYALSVGFLTPDPETREDAPPRLRRRVLEVLEDPGLESG